MPLIAKLFPSKEEKTKSSYVRYIQKRNFLIVMISISVFIGICLILFTILCKNLLKRNLIRDKNGQPYKDGWFLWPMWIFYAISMAIVTTQSYTRFKELRALMAELFPSKLQATEDQQQQQQQEQQKENSNADIIVENAGNSIDIAPVNYAEETFDDTPTRRQQRKELRARLTLDINNE
jgi:hypothetical protein